MSWRHPTDDELAILQRALSRVPEKHRWEIKDISVHGTTGLQFSQQQGYWWVQNVVSESIPEDYWCPTASAKTMCPGPCPDGTEHEKLC